MPGMGTGLSNNNPTVVSAFHAALLKQGLVVLLILFFVGVAWNLLRSAQLRQAAGGEGEAVAAAESRLAPEPVARRLLRVSFGLIWIFDGVLQAQSSMPLGMVPEVIKPAAANSPGWVQHLVNAVVTLWSYHPVNAPAAAVWIQIGIGVWLLAAPRGTWSRLGGAASAGWGLIVWVFGEAFGQVLSPGLTWLFGAPGGVIFYCAAGILLTLPERSWAAPRLGRTVLRLMGFFFAGMALLQAWPGRGFWQGQPSPSAAPGTLTSMVQQMAQTPQPRIFASIVSSFAGFDAAHGWAVNLFAVVALALIGAAFVSARPRVVRVGVIAGVVLCLADWVLIEDLGFLGGVGTDPNSMIPMALVFVAGYLALTRAQGTEVPASLATTSAARSWREWLVARPTYTFRTIAAIGALGITLVGAAPMAVAATDPHADPILSEAVDGTPSVVDYVAPSFRLTDQYDQTVSLRSLRGKVVALTFLDPVCTSDCPLIAQEFRDADGILGSESRRVELVAIDANPRYITPDYLVAFDQQERLDEVANWRYLTGSLSQLERTWNAYGAQVSYAPAGAMVAHSEFAVVIDERGRTRYLLDADPGPGTDATQSSFAVTLADALKQAMANP
jgi:cytochrome oxidase Cu insertion factor (SCO1/SenC/PrrC family)